MTALNLNDLQVFVQVVDHGGFTAAAKALNLPKQTLSKRVTELERRAGVRLIQRTTRSFAVTELGQELYRHAAAMVIEAEAAQNIILGRLAEPSGTVRITASVPTSQNFLAPLLPRIAQAFPKISVVVKATDSFVDVVQDGFDIAIRDHTRPLADSGLVQRRLRKQAFWLVAAPDYLARRAAVHSPADIDGADGIFASQGDREWTLENGETSAVVSAHPRYCFNEGTGLLQAATAGLGIVSLPSTMCREAVDAGILCRILPDWTAGEVTTTLLMPHRRGQLPSVRAVANLLIEHQVSRPVVDEATYVNASARR